MFGDELQVDFDVHPGSSSVLKDNGYEIQFGVLVDLVFFPVFG